MGPDISLFTPHANMHAARLTWKACVRRSASAGMEKVRRFAGENLQERGTAGWMG